MRRFAEGSPTGVSARSTDKPRRQKASKAAILFAFAARDGYNRIMQTIKISVIRNRTPQTISSLLCVWERSVRATHDFLSDAEIRRIRAYVPQALQSVQRLIAAESESGAVAAFAGVENRRIEMLFVAPEQRGAGIGKALLRYAVRAFGADEVTVNEQNAQAVGFYEHMGFTAYRRTDTDEQGGPYPLLYMRL